MNSFVCRVVQEHGERGSDSERTALYQCWQSFWTELPAAAGRGRGSGSGAWGFHLCFLQMILSCWPYRSLTLQLSLGQFEPESGVAEMKIRHTDLGCTVCVWNFQVSVFQNKKLQSWQTNAKKSWISSFIWNSCHKLTLNRIEKKFVAIK